MYQIFNTAKSTWDQQLDDIKNAKSSIYFEQYILSDFQDGEIGRQFIDALMNKAQEGLEVRLILDFQGSIGLFKDPDLNQKLKDSGLIIDYYKTLPFFRAFSPIRIMLRDHRKFLLIDHEITWIGGVVVGEDFREWSDLMVRFTDLQIADFSNREFKRQLQRIGDGGIILAPLDRIDSEHTLVGNSPGLGNRYCYERMAHQILLAKKSVVIVTPYFAPPLRMRRVIERRLSEGLEITLVIPKHSDHEQADWAREVILNQLLKMGLIVKYLDFMNHAKIIAADHDWVTFGSTNIDALSLISNHELNMETTDTNLVTDIYKEINNWSKDTSRINNKTLLYKSLSAKQKFIGIIMRYLV